MASSLYGTRILPHRYNHFFNPNLCHVCKYKNQKYLKLCSDCSMITYCSEEHRLQHRTQHKEICEAIKEISKTKCLWITRGLTDDEWVKHKKENLQAIKAILCRKLVPYEEQMFLLAKSCGICHQQQDVKIVCTECLHFNLCDDHESSPITHKCLQLKRSLYLDIYEFLEKQNVKIPIFDLPETRTDIRINSSTKAIVNYFRKKGKLRVNWKFIDYIYSNAISGPLTVASMIDRTDPIAFLISKKTHVLHIIAGSLTDKESLSAWEMLLHVLYKPTNILIIIIEAGLQIDEEDIGDWDICELCRIRKKTLTFQVHDMSYKSYVECSSYVPPDAIIGFNVEIEELGKDTIKILQRQKCLVVLTFISHYEMRQIILEIDKTIELSPGYIAIRENKFQSHRPYRDIKKDTFFPNKCVLFFGGNTGLY